MMDDGVVPVNTGSVRGVAKAETAGRGLAVTAQAPRMVAAGARIHP